MSQAISAGDCAHATCADGQHVTVEFPGGARRDYCEYHAEIVVRDSAAEVVGRV